MENENKREFKGVWIPREIWLDKSLSLNEKFYFALFIENGMNEKKTDEMMLQIFSRGTICSAKKALSQKGKISFISDPYFAKKIVLESKIDGEKCEWCGARSIALQVHHFPIPKYKGGKETVKICPNCHAEYHTVLKFWRSK